MAFLSEIPQARRELEFLVVLEGRGCQPRTNMNAKIWSKLPDELLQHVVRLLPLADVFTWRCVNRHWRDVVSVMERLRSWAGTRTTALLSCDWKRACLRQELPPQLRVSALHLRPPRAGLPKYLKLEACAASGGLICFREVWDSRLFICNPLTRVWKELPYVPEIDRHCLQEEIHLITDGSGESYKVFRISQLVRYKQVRFIFDSTSGVWARVSEPPPIFQNDRGIRVCHNGLLMHFRCCGTTVAGLDLETGVYQNRDIHPALAYSPAAIVEHLGFLYYIGLRTVRKSCHLYRLCDATGRWDHLEVGSLEWLQPPCEGDYRIQVAGCSNYICISLHRPRSSQCSTYKDPCSRIVAFDLAANSWSCWAEDQGFFENSLLPFELSFRRP